MFSNQIPYMTKMVGILILCLTISVVIIIAMVREIDGITYDMTISNKILHQNHAPNL